MKTPDDIKKGLEVCGTAYACLDCPYREEKASPYGCGDARDSDALAYIEELEQRLAQAERERDALAYDMHQLQGALCAYCENLHKKDGADHASCKVFGDDYGTPDGFPLVCGKFKWRGVCKENSKEG